MEKAETLAMDCIKKYCKKKPDTSDKVKAGQAPKNIVPDGSKRPDLPNGHKL